MLVYSIVAGVIAYSYATLTSVHEGKIPTSYRIRLDPFQQVYLLSAASG